jgi:cyanophycinase
MKPFVIRIGLLVFLTSFSVAAQEIRASARIGFSGDEKDVAVKTEFGIVLMGGSTDVDEAFKWMIDRAPGGDFVIIRASGSVGYNEYVYKMGNVNSVETLLINSREKANLAETARILREADALFIAGGDQANYVKYWSNTEVSKAIDFLVNEKKIPIGGTSAGCAVLSDIIFDALHDSIQSEEALANPYNEKVSLSKSFIRIPLLKDIITDQHYSQRKRQGRHVTFMARMKNDFDLNAKGIAVDEKTAVCISENGDAKVLGKNNAFFIASGKNGPEICSAGTSLQWYQNRKALRVYVINGNSEEQAAFNIRKWKTNKSHQFWYVENGILKTID